jgi:hypothetical protein
MRESMRLYATMFIWIAFTAMTIVLFTSNNNRINDYDVIPILGILAGTAFLSTVAIWMAGGRGKAEAAARADTSRAKRKRINGELLARLVDGLNDDELDELDLLLSAREDDMQQGQYRQ